LVPTLSANGRVRMEFIGSIMDLASGTAREPVTKSTCRSTTTRAGMNLSDVSEGLEADCWAGVMPGIMSGMMNRTCFLIQSLRENCNSEGNCVAYEYKDLLAPI